MINRNFMSLDLEMNQPSGSIIQIGYCIGNLETGKILDRGEIAINPNEVISPYIVQLTGVTQKYADSGYSLQEGYDILKDRFQDFDCFRNPIVWGGGDSELLRSQLGLDDDLYLFGRRHIDTKTLYVSLRFANCKPHQGGLAKAMTKFGLNFQGRKHNACDDAYNTFIMYRELLKLLEGKNEN